MDTTGAYNWSLDVPDNFAGNSQAFDGNAYAGIITYMLEDTFQTIAPVPASQYYNYREYLQYRINQPLVAGQKYVIRFRAKLSSKSRVITNLGVALTADSINNSGTGPINATPLIETLPDTSHTNWFVVFDTITASGNEQFVTIGNFRDDAQSNLLDAFPGNMITSNYGGFKAFASYFYIDAVIINPFFQPIIERFTIASGGATYSDSAMTIDASIGQPLSATFWNSTEQIYFTQGFQQPFDNTIPTPKNQFATVNDGLRIRYYPNPTPDKVNIIIESDSVNTVDVFLFDFLGNQIGQTSMKFQDGTYPQFQQDLSAFPTGTYYIKLLDNLNRFSILKVIYIQ